MQPVATAFASKATAVFSSESASPIIPDPTMLTSSKAVPKNSAKSRFELENINTVQFLGQCRAVYF